jgi:hypothetical protein
MNRLLLLLAGVWALGASAQSRATLIDAPLDVRVPMPAAQSQALQSDFRQLLARKSGTLVPTPSAWKAAVAALRRQDCDVRDECLRQLAVNGASLYALFASIERNAAGTEYTASGRVVNQDGALTRGPVKVVVSAAAKDATTNALVELMTALKLDTLPAVLEQPVTAKVAEPVKPQPQEGTLVQPLPPPPPMPPMVVSTPAPESGPSAGRVAGFLLLGVGVAAAATSVGFGVSSAVQRSELPLDGRFTDDAQAVQQARVNTFATISLGTAVGAGVSLISAIVLLAASSPQQTVAIVPAIGPSGVSATLVWSLR